MATTTAPTTPQNLAKGGSAPASSRAAQLASAQARGPKGAANVATAAPASTPTTAAPIPTMTTRGSALAFQSPTGSFTRQGSLQRQGSMGLGALIRLGDSFTAYQRENSLPLLTNIIPADHPHYDTSFNMSMGVGMPSLGMLVPPRVDVERSSDASAKGCAVASCTNNDFSLECAQCKKQYCREHLMADRHDCTPSAKPQTAECPLCRATLPCLNGEDVRTTLQRHAQLCVANHAVPFAFGVGFSPHMMQQAAAAQLAMPSAVPFASAHSFRPAHMSSSSSALSSDKRKQTNSLPKLSKRPKTALDQSGLEALSTASSVLQERGNLMSATSSSGTTSTAASVAANGHKSTRPDEELQRVYVVVKQLLEASTNVNGPRMVQLAGTFRTKYAAFHNRNSPPGRSPAEQVYLLAIILYFLTIEQSPSSKMDRDTAAQLDPLTALNDSLLNSKQGEIGALLTQLQTMADALLMNDLELAVWTIYADRLEPNWMHTENVALRMQQLFFVGYCVKMMFVRTHIEFLPLLDALYQDFGHVFQKWLDSKTKVRLSVPPIVLNERFTVLKSLH